MNHEIFIISRFFKSSYFCFRSKTVFLQFLVDILPLGAGSMDPHIFVDQDQSGSIFRIQRRSNGQSRGWA